MSFRIDTYEPRWLDTVLNCEAHISCTAATLTQDSVQDPKRSFLESDCEPLPPIDYALMHGLIFVNPTLNKHDKKRFDYIIDARKLYFDTHNQFQAAYRSLQDLYAHSVTLDKQKAEYESQGLMDLENMRYNERARALTLREMRSLLPEMMKLHRKRTDVAIYFSDMKLKFLQTDVPRLVYIGRKVYQRAMGLDSEYTLLSRIRSQTSC